uniref:Kinetochore protein Nuf2 n=1 Tax=Mycena chlorophos TaxID=658473 RepID=A0ABQ0M782_MYCCL|nr:predicted protein [Mycena chlorophos]
MPKGIYPQLHISDIVAALDQWGFPVSPEQLSKPTPDLVEGVYCACLWQVTKLNNDALRDPTQRALNQSQPFDKDIHTNSLPSRIIFLHLARLARAARSDEFSATDLHAPTKDRTLRHLSAFINFVKFTEQFCYPFVAKLQDSSEKIVHEHERVTRKLNEVTEEINKLKAKMAEDEPKCEQLRAQASELRARLFANKQVQVETVDQVEKLKAEKTALVQRKEALNGEVESVSDSLSRTRSRIVQSPERIKRSITTMTAGALQDKQMIALNESKARDLQSKITALSNIEKDVRGCVEQLQTIEKEVRSLQDSQKELGDLKDVFDRRQIDQRELHGQRERLLRQLSNAQEKLERAQRHAEERKAASQRTIVRLQAEYDAMVIERRDTDKEVEEVRAQANEIETKMAEHLKTSEAELNQLLAEYWKLRHNTDLYMHTLATKLNMKVDMI